MGLLAGSQLHLLRHQARHGAHYRQASPTCSRCSISGPRILAPEKLADFIDNSSIKMPIFSENGDAAAYAYGYDLPTLKRLAVIPVLPRPTRCSSPTCTSSPTPRSSTSTPSMTIAACLAWSPTGDAAEPAAPVNTDLNDIEPWTHFFVLRLFAATHVPAARMKPGYPRSTPTPSPD